MLAPPNQSLDIASPSKTPEGVGMGTHVQVSSKRAFHTPQSDNVRLMGWLWLLPGRRGLTVLGVIGLLFGLRILIGRPLDVQRPDRRGLPTAERIASLAGVQNVDPDAGVWEKRLTWDGSVELEYNYRSERPGQIAVRSLMWVDDTQEQALETFQRLQLNLVFDWGIGTKEEVGLVWLDEFDQLGDESRLYRVEKERDVLGHSIAIRKDERTVYAKIEGDVLEDAELRTLAEDLLLGIDSVVVP